MTPPFRSFGPGFPKLEIVRLGVPPREESPVQAPARGYPHAASTLDRARELIESTPLSYREIARQTGVSIATISRRAKAGAWVRPQTHMPLEHYTPNGRRILKRRELASRLMHQAERWIRQLETDPQVKPSTLALALRMAKAAKMLDEMDERRGKGKWGGD
jgi:hypothetical protein